MGRRASYLVVTALLLLAVAQPARAGGSWLDVSDGASVRMGPWELPYAGVGSTVTMRSEFSDGQQAPVSAGPWYAYITLDTDVGGEPTEPMLLGPVHIADTGGYPYVATTTFVRPRMLARCRRSRGRHHRAGGDRLGGPSVRPFPDPDVDT